MDNWSRLIDAGRELAHAFSLLDRAQETACPSVAAVITKEGLLTAARDAVTRANTLLYPS